MGYTSKLAILPLTLTLLLTISLAQQHQLFGQSTQQTRLHRGQQIGNDCQINQLTASEPSNRIESEAGVTEIWESNEQQELKCAGVTVVRHQIEPKGLALPHYVNAPIISYVINGRGMIGVNIPGCPETYESSISEESFSEERREREGREREGREREFERSSFDQHQKVRRLRQGEVIALPAGVSKWIYNDGQERLTLISLYDTNNFQNQLDENLKAFFLAGNPQGRKGEQGRRHHHETRRHGGRGEEGQQTLGQNIFSAFDEDILMDTFKVDRETINALQGRNDNRGAIIRVDGDLEILSPVSDPGPEEERLESQRHRGGSGRRGREEEEERRERHHRRGQEGREEEEERRERHHRRGQEGREEEEERRERHHRRGQEGREEEEERRERERERRHRRGQEGREEEEERWERERERHQGRGGRGRRGGSNGVEQTLCSARLTENIDDSERADVFNPLGGRLTSLNSHKLPILNFLQLSAEKVNLYQNAILAPHWRINAHTIAYFTRGQGRIQVVNHEGRLVFDDTVNEGQLLVIPQNFAVVKRAGRDGLEWVSFLTNDESMINPLAGRISAIRGMPVEVVMNSFKVSREEAQKLKYNRPELTVFSPGSRSDRRGEEFAIV